MKRTKNSFTGPFTERYEYDEGLCSIDNGFAQVDTRQDASFFGIWASPIKRQIVCFAEGDLTVDTYDTDKEFTAGVIDLWSWNEDHIGGDFGIDCGWPLMDGKGMVDRLTTEFTRLGLAELLH